MRDLPEMDGFGVLIFQVLGQQLSVTSTRSILNRLTALFSGRLPTASELLAEDPERIRSAGLSHRKVQTLRLIAERFTDGTLSMKALRSMSDEDVQARLTAIPGVGPWTAQGFLIIALGREDVVLPGDLALRTAIKRAYGLDRLPSPDEVLAIADGWRPYRTLATTYVFASVYDAQNAFR
jgi:DNA-3-methyladenine glycosylase II